MKTPDGPKTTVVQVRSLHKRILKVVNVLNVSYYSMKVPAFHYIV